MARLNSDNVLAAVSNVLKEKKVLASRERMLIRQLNRVLKKMGYEVVKLSGQPQRGRKGRGRSRKTSLLSTVAQRVGRPPKGEQKRRGRPSSKIEG